jgi:hypothetical protein
MKYRFFNIFFFSPYFFWSLAAKLESELIKKINNVYNAFFFFPFILIIFFFFIYINFSFNKNY